MPFMSFGVKTKDEVIEKVLVHVIALTLAALNNRDGQKANRNW